ncbi:uridine diphosphate glucose pyrophosphatase NUDT14-like [Chrysoperla carnea]|uniref:uridine diphosphate glucose pyrophosphatase NUDT14-like n=1 Tax=Chrysoperla carnea TaxID=189513 RepID=UPI001D08B3DB|nr:uridine diphosphate glucose pyrophosphatase NUDT14-like [Chrysoperla carnea]XP_044729143.1 uridine diphosphate glucose pyrophosphatase NUDT14-like [Chrysoperla carnea]
MNSSTTENRCSTNITDIQITKCKYSEIFQPFRLTYKMNNEERNWDIIKTENRIDVCIFNTTTKKLLLWKKFRPGAYLVKAFGKELPDESTIDLQKYPIELGLTYEFCSGSVQNNQSIENTVESLIETCTGYKVSSNNIEKVVTYCFDTSPAGNQSTFFYCEINNSMKVSLGENCEDLVELSIEEVMELTAGKSTINTTDNLLFGLIWFLLNKKEKYSIK